MGPRDPMQGETTEAIVENQWTPTGKAQGAAGHSGNIKADRLPLGNKQDIPLTFYF